MGSSSPTEPQSTHIEGRLDGVENGHLVGWARKPGVDALEIDIHVDGEFLCTTRASRRRADLLLVGLGATAFRTPLPISVQDGRTHAVLITEAGQSAPLIGTPVSLYVPERRAGVSLVNAGPPGTASETEEPSASLATRLARLRPEPQHPTASFNPLRLEIAWLVSDAPAAAGDLAPVCALAARMEALGHACAIWVNPSHRRDGAAERLREHLRAEHARAPVRPMEAEGMLRADVVVCTDFWTVQAARRQGAAWIMACLGVLDEQDRTDERVDMGLDILDELLRSDAGPHRARPNAPGGVALLTSPKRAQDWDPIAARFAHFLTAGLTNAGIAPRPTIPARPGAAIA